MQYSWFREKLTVLKSSWTASASATTLEAMMHITFGLKFSSSQRKQKCTQSSKGALFLLEGNKLKSKNRICIHGIWCMKENWNQTKTGCRVPMIASQCFLLVLSLYIMCAPLIFFTTSWTRNSVAVTTLGTIWWTSPKLHSQAAFNVAE